MGPLRSPTSSPSPGRQPAAGFSIIELMVAVVVVAVLAVVSFPIHRKYVRHARTTEATTRLGEIIDAARTYAVQNPDAAGNPIWPPASGGGLVSLAATPCFSYAIRSGAGRNARTNALAVRAVGRSGTRMAGVTITMTAPSIDRNAGNPVVIGL